MATINATFSFSSDVSTYGMSISNDMTMSKADSTTGLDQATGLVRKTLTSTNEVDLLTVGSGVVADVPTNKATKLYIKNVNSDSSEYFTVGFGASSGGASKQAFAVTDDANRSVELGRLYSGDFLIIPWCAASDENDVFVKPSVATNMVIEYMVFYE
jgi:hypothetical protein